MAFVLHRCKLKENSDNLIITRKNGVSLKGQRITENRGSFEAALRFPVFLKRRGTTADTEGSRLFHVSSVVRVL